MKIQLTCVKLPEQYLAHNKCPIHVSHYQQYHPGFASVPTHIFQLILEEGKRYM